MMSYPADETIRSTVARMYFEAFFGPLFSSSHPSIPSPTTPNITLLTTHRTTPPAATKPRAVRYPHPSSILSASIFWKAIAHRTPRRTQSTPPPCVERKLNAKVPPVLMKAGSTVEVEFEASGVSPYFQTTIKMGNKDMQELTKRAVEIELGVGFFGGAGGGVMAVPFKLALGPPSFVCSYFAVAPSFQIIASQRMVKC